MSRRQLSNDGARCRLHGKLVATYESAATRRFRLGRVDNIRSASSASLAWVSAMSDPQASVSLALFDECTRPQSGYSIIPRALLDKRNKTH